ncbi:MAG TPA: glycosyltransferase family 39 protein [Tepidisphaeraceae bacterium]|nr:glycosyltransferase family 39 protein [Tepidisphaeraceae bacterium]
MSDRQILILILLSFAVRFGISACSLGTNDTLTFIRFAHSIDRHGILATYHGDSEFNHPPLPAYWAWLVMRITQPSKYWFAFLFRVLPILADAGSVWLVYRAGRARFGEIRSLAAAALLAWCPVMILISAHHTNTDSIYTFFCLLSVYLMECRSRAFLGGLALAAAINIKLIPVLMIAPMLLSMRRWSDAGRFVAGLALAIVPFLGPLLLARADFVHNVLAYPSSYNLWGVDFFLSPWVPNPNKLPRVVLAYRDIGRVLIVVLVLSWSVAGRVLGRWNRYDLVAATFAIFLVFTPGIGIQYLVVLVPVLFAVRPGLATAYGFCAGALSLSAYELAWDGHFPIESLFHGLFPTRVAWIGLIAWLELVCYLILLWQPSEQPRPAITHA